MRIEEKRQYENALGSKAFFYCWAAVKYLRKSIRCGFFMALFEGDMFSCGLDYTINIMP
jgi:hypothetical protein